MIANIISKKQKFYKEILKHLFFNKQLSCADLSNLIGKSIPLTTQYLSELISLKMVVEKGYAVSTGGRRPQTYSIKNGVLYVVAVAMDQLVTRVALISNDNTIVGEVEKFDLVLANNPNSLKELIKHLEAFIERSNIPHSKIAGIGIGMPGFVDVAKGINHTFLPCKNGSITSNIEAALKIPTLIDNDSSLVGLAELKWGAAKNKRHVMVINIGWGIGLGIISDGKLFRGTDGFAGEFSHIPLFDNNKICSCGKHGCLETETSLLVVAQKGIKTLKKQSQPSLLKELNIDRIEESAKSIIEAAQKGDKFSIELISDAAYNIGRGVAILIHLMNPELIVISGIGSLAGKVWIAPIQQAVNEHCIPKISEHTEIKISQLGYNAELIGATSLIMDNYEKLPKLLNEKAMAL
ncbi:ROK family protein [Niabella ginsengisoli]|uniref:ROK family protein n=1 Tax=Niabella ginsengisoli TaxID=522298 RepID=A0ABS9SH23_9BACT|nr:ROK family protein [Niabella ginsengisoli]MCH5597625.1 ROK family protein [Niabella ginsengisoli]